MSGRGGGGGRRVLLPPINFIFKLLQGHTTVSIWLYEQLGIRIEGKIRGFDEFSTCPRGVHPQAVRNRFASRLEDG